MYNFRWDHAWKGRLTKPMSSPLPIEDYVKRLTQDLKDDLLPFIDMSYQPELEKKIHAITPFLHKFKYMIVLGIGGSALGAKALQKAFSPQQDRPNHEGRWLWIMDNIDNESVNALFTSLDPNETLIVTISKSGETIETIAQYFLIKDWFQNVLNQHWKDHFLFVTDEEKGFLRKEAQVENIQFLSIPKYLGGRYSILSAVGLIPAAFLGIDWPDLLNGTKQVMQPLHNATAHSLQKHPSWKIAEWCYSLLKQKYTQLIFFTYIPAWATFGQWFTQLWAESLGKSGNGSMPIAAVGVTDQHSTQQMFLDGPKDKGCILLSTEDYGSSPVFSSHLPNSWQWLQHKHLSDLIDAERIGTAAALVKNNVPLLQLQFDKINCYSTGELLGIFMAATVFTGWLLHINPLDQPAVELGKRLARITLGNTIYPEEAAILKNFLKTNHFEEPV